MKQQKSDLKEAIKQYQNATAAIAIANYKINKLYNLMLIILAVAAVFFIAALAFIF